MFKKEECSDKIFILTFSVPQLTRRMFRDRVFQARWATQFVELECKHVTICSIFLPSTYDLEDSILFQIYFINL